MDADTDYLYDLDAGPRLANGRKGPGVPMRGRALLALGHGTLDDADDLKAAKRLLAAALERHLDGRALKTSGVMRALSRRASTKGRTDHEAAGGIALGVNIDHVATLRQARGTRLSRSSGSSGLGEGAGADSITVHLREDRRHIQERDVLQLKKTLKTHMNLEMAVEEAMLAFACACFRRTAVWCRNGAGTHHRRRPGCERADRAPAGRLRPTAGCRHPGRTVHRS